MKKAALLFLLISNFLSSQTWQPLTSIPSNTVGGNQRFDDVFFLNENLGWAANGGFAEVFKTTDGGATWTSQITWQLLGSYHYFRNIEFLDENIGFLGTLNQKFYKTIDGGTTWSLVTNITPNPVAICGLDCVGTSTVYGCGTYYGPPLIIKSTDSGNTWQYIDMSAYANALVDINFINENIGFVTGNNATGGVVLKTIDGGTTWTQLLNTGTNGDFVWKLQVLSSNNNVLFGSVEAASPNIGRLAKSIDGGLTWTLQNAPESEIQAVGFLDENHGWMGGHTTGFYETIDGGASWTNTGVGSNLNRIFFIGNTAYASGRTIYKMSSLLSNPDFEEHNRVNLNVKVSPNPVVDKLNIEIDFPAEDHIIIDLYDSTGKLAKKLVKDDINTVGIKKYSFDFPYPTGTYFINFHSNTGRQSTKIIKN
ncbi:T9SS type A sorting domain-containing protein [Flavobacterium terrigena]|uniref:Por secretion system C-terminal sorting domain-containing protein n=1 Tax=Flavobacterium terrigena TaxID=402734 RepID=A0A1H6STW7_9FLAO|nr:T9SS type A sorting domain-containing protein [Flavobacterium terrigena]SEI71418.1 Por secretion system C-terminal sorting domain-containing protein [Flavobacterium terrigena]